jgi:hypothetical protein
VRVAALVPRVVLALLAAAPSAVPALAAEAPLGPPSAIPVGGPVDVDELLRLARIKQALNARTYYQYAFRQTTRAETLDATGNVSATEVRVYRVVPAPEGTQRHLLEVDGDLPSRRMVRTAEKRNQRVRERWAKIRERQARDRERRRAGAERQAGAAASPAVPTAPAATPGLPDAPPSDATAGPNAPPSDAPPAAAATGPNAAAGPNAEGASRGLTTAPAPTAPPAPPPIAGAPAPPRPPQVEPLPTDIPDCHPDDLTARVRPGATPGDAATARRAVAPPPVASRRDRESTGDYSLFELLSLTAYDYAGTCRWDDRVVHVVTFMPPDGFDPQNPVERVVGAMEGTILIDATELQVVRAEGETVAPIKWGAGLVALREARVIFESAKINDEVWLPSADYFELDTRVLLGRDRQRVTNYYDQYEKLLVATEDEVVGIVSEGPGG